MQPLIGITGRAGSGKSTAAQFLADELAYSRQSFAEPLKVMMFMLFGQMGIEPYDAQEMVYGALKETPIPGLNCKTPRQLMQTLGTEWGRNCNGDDFWVDIMKARLNRNDGNVVIDDVRFSNEAQMIRDMGGIVIHLHRDGAGTTSLHVSEQLADMGAVTSILNNGSISDLSRQLLRVVA